jgi:predicted Zn-dependent peptidase
MARPSGAKQPVPVDQRVCAAVRRAVLPNGIRVITDTTAAAGNVAAISIAIQAGARQEMPSESGLANLTAQVAMLETVSQTALERARQGERWRAGVEVDSEHTIFRATADAASVAAAMAHLAEAIQNATCGPATIELERRAILRGIEMAGGRRRGRRGCCCGRRYGGITGWAGR